MDESRTRRFGLQGIVVAALAAGLVAGLVTAVFHSAVTEPVIEQAIALEEAATAQHHSATATNKAEGPIVSREFQRGPGLFAGFILYGTFWALLFAVAFFLGRQALPWTSPLAQGLAFGALGAWSLGIMPFLKYPANPPAVGDPDTVGLRQTLFLVYIALSVFGAAAALAASLATDRQPGWSILRRAGVVLGGYAVFAILLVLLMPSNPDTIAIPMEMVNTFRVRSVAGLVVFWLAFGVAFGLLLRRFEGQDGRQALAGAPAPRGT